MRITLLVTPCLVVLSAGMRAVYTSHAFDNRLTPHAIALIGALSVGAAAIAVADRVRLSPGRRLGRCPYWGPVEEVVVPWIHYSLVLAGWSLCYFWIHAEMAEQAEHRHAVRAEAEALRARARGAAPAARSAFPVQCAERRGRGNPRASDRGARHAAQSHGLPAQLARRYPPDDRDGRHRGRRAVGLPRRAEGALRRSAAGRTSMSSTPPAGGGSRASCCSRWSRTPSSMAGARRASTSISTSAPRATSCTSRSRTPARSKTAQARAGAGRASAWRTSGAVSTCTIPAATPSRWATDGDRVVAKLTLEGEPCSGS